MFLYYCPQTKFREGYVFTAVCDSVHGDTTTIPPGAGISQSRPPPSEQTHLPEQTPPGSRHHPCAVHAGSMHPTGMQSCLQTIVSIFHHRGSDSSQGSENNFVLFCIFYMFDCFYCLYNVWYCFSYFYLWTVANGNMSRWVIQCLSFFLWYFFAIIFSALYNDSDISGNVYYWKDCCLYWSSEVAGR